VIPAYKETSTFYSRFIDSALAKEKNLLILVINQPDSETDPLPQKSLSQFIEHSGTIIWQELNLKLLKLAHSHVLIVDRFSSGNSIADKEGVGLARKIGADIATTLIHNGLIHSPWICSTDADTFLPDNYFSVLAEVPPKTSAVTYKFSHINNRDNLSIATKLYEQALNYYVCGLQYAGSSYAFHTVGSSLAFHYKYYALVRGFPKRSAAEDFYLLNKLAKQGCVRELTSATLLITPRTSDRVPFGTGPAVSKIISLYSPDHDYLYYHPQLFKELKNCLTALQNLWHYKENPDLWLKQLSEAGQYALKQLQFSKLLQHINQNAKNETQCGLQIEQWFDAFRTLKFIRILQTSHFPAIPLKQAITKAPFDIT